MLRGLRARPYTAAMDSDGASASPRSGRRTRSRLLLGLAALVATILVADWLVWRQATGQLDDGFNAWLAAMRANGWTVQSGDRVRAGWPLTADLVIHDLGITLGPAVSAGALAWSTEHTRLSISPLTPHSLLINAEGQQALQLGPTRLPYTAALLTARLSLTADRTGTLTDLQGTDIRMTVPDATSPLIIDGLKASGEHHPAAQNGQPFLDASLTAESITLPDLQDGAIQALGPRLASVHLEGTLNGPLSPTADLAATATAWRDAGGTLVIRRFAAGWGMLAASGGFTLFLDDALQPAGAGTVKVVGYDAALDALAQHKVLTARAAQTARAVLGLLARQPEAGGAPVLDVPLIIKARALSMGPIPLAKLPDLVWPG